jgi:predicted HTH transcriptional regulator
MATLITAGESGTVEFKSTFQWNVHTKQADDTLQLMVLKSIAAFLNTDGGHLLIGVADDGSIFGLEKDLRLVGGKNPVREQVDKFELRLTTLITEQIGVLFTQFIRYQFEEVEGKMVCWLIIKKASEPAFIDGNDFYIRAGNQTRKLKTMEVVRYAGQRWG